MSTPKMPDARVRSKIGNVKVGDWVRLPRSGRDGPPPEWPLQRVEMDDDYARIWARLWRSPMALMWDQSQEACVEVALYAIWSYAAETSIDASRELRYYSDRLGLNPMARLKLHWMIVDDEDSDLEHPPVRRAAAGRSQPSRRRLVVVEDKPS